MHVSKEYGGSNGAFPTTASVDDDDDLLEPIAIIGFSMRFPQEATSPDGLWKILMDGRSVMTEIPPERFNINGFYHPDASHSGTVRFLFPKHGDEGDSWLHRSTVEGATF
jgi:hypothetical protein